MADIVDQSDERQNQVHEMKIKQVQEDAGRQEAQATGECLHCSEPVDAPRRWCDFDCMSAWEQEKRMKGMR